MKIYRSSFLKRVVYSVIAAAVLIMGLWVILYAINRKSYDWPMAAAGILLCSYMVYILQKLFTYKVMLDDDHMEIHKLDSVLTVRFEDIIHIHRKRSVCYIIDRVMDGGEYYIRGVKPPMKYSQGMKKVKIRFSRLPALQRAYVEDYQDIVKTIMSKVKLDSITVNK